MRFPNSRQICTILALALAGGAAAACSDDGRVPRSAAATTAVPPIHVSAVPNVANSSSLVFPIDAYLFTDDQFIEIDRATNVLTDQCMQQFGIRFTAPPPNILPGTSTDSNAPRRYGVSDAASVAVLGYHPPSGAPFPEKPALDQTDLTVLTGISNTNTSPPTTNPSTYHGRPIPSGGCIGQARAKLTAHGGTTNNAPLADSINQTSLSLSQREPQVITAIKQWSACMTVHGYTYATPYDAINDPQWNTPKASPREIRTASADVACKQQTNLIGTWYAVEAALQRNFIATHQPQMAPIKTGIAAELAVASRVLGND